LYLGFSEMSEYLMSMQTGQTDGRTDGPLHWDFHWMWSPLAIFIS